MATVRREKESGGLTCLRETYFSFHIPVLQAEWVRRTRPPTERKLKRSAGRQEKAQEEGTGSATVTQNAPHKRQDEKEYNQTRDVHLQ